MADFWRPCSPRSAWADTAVPSAREREARHREPELLRAGRGPRRAGCTVRRRARMPSRPGVTDRQARPLPKRRRPSGNRESVRWAVLRRP